MKIKPSVLGVVSLALLAQTGCERADVGAPEPPKPRLVFITGGSDSFWQLAIAGVAAAAKDFEVEFELLADAKAADGVAHCPSNGIVQLATEGSACLIGVDHYKAGRRAGQLVKEAFPSWGKIFIFSETPDLPEAQARRQGVLDELSDRLAEEFVAVDDMNHPGLAGVVALSGRDLAHGLEALCATDKLGAVKLIGFDEYEGAQEALAAGHVYAIVTHQPYQYGYHSVRVLAGLARGDLSVLPKSGFLEIPILVLRRETASHASARK